MKFKALFPRFFGCSVSDIKFHLLESQKSGRTSQEGVAWLLASPLNGLRPNGRDKDWHVRVLLRLHQLLPPKRSRKGHPPHPPRKEPGRGGRSGGRGRGCWLKWWPDDFGFWLQPQNLIIRIESCRPGIPLQSSAPSMALGILVDRWSAVKWVQWVVVVVVGVGLWVFGSLGVWVSG